MLFPIPAPRVRATERQEVPFRLEDLINSGRKWPIPPIFQTETEWSFLQESGIPPEFIASTNPIWPWYATALIQAWNTLATIGRQYNVFIDGLFCMEHLIIPSLNTDVSFCMQTIPRARTAPFNK